MLLEYDREKGTKTMDTQALKELTEQVVNFEKFVKRRFDEISMEINATSMQLGTVETDITQQFKDIMGVLSAISFSGDGKSQVNAGVELEAVISDTENAANSIMDAADRIANRLRTEGNLNDPETREKVLGEIKSEVQNILLACTFQDLTSQRIRKTLENLHLIETRLTATLERMGIRPEVTGAEIIAKANETRVQSQSDIDALFN